MLPLFDMLRSQLSRGIGFIGSASVTCVVVVWGGGSATSSSRLLHSSDTNDHREEGEEWRDRRPSRAGRGFIIVKRRLMDPEGRQPEKNLTHETHWTVPSKRSSCQLCECYLTFRNVYLKIGHFPKKASVVGGSASFSSHLPQSGSPSASPNELKPLLIFKIPFLGFFFRSSDWNGWKWKTTR